MVDYTMHVWLQANPPCKKWRALTVTVQTIGRQFLTVTSCGAMLTDTAGFYAQSSLPKGFEGIKS